MVSKEKDAFIIALRSIYSDSGVPAVYLNPDLSLMYANNSAKLYYRMFCVHNGVSDYIGEEGVRSVLGRLSVQDIVKYSPGKMSAFDALIFTNVYSREGVLQGVQLRAEENNALHCAVNKFFPNIDISDIITNEFLSPITNTQMALDYLRRKLPADDTLTKYLDLMVDNTYKAMLAVHKFNDIVNVRMDAMRIDDNAVNALLVASMVFKHFDIEFTSDPSVAENPIIFGSEELLSKILTDSLLFISGLDFLNKLKKSVSAEMDADERSIILTVYACRVRGAAGEDIFSPSFSGNGELRANLFGVRHLVSNLGGTVEAGYERRGSVCFRLRICMPKIFDTNAALTDVGDGVEELLTGKFYAKSRLIDKMPKG